MVKRGRKKKQEGHENNTGSERWLITYSDLITLLLVFFIVLYSMSEIQNDQYNALVQSLQTAFHGDTLIDQSSNPPTSNVTVPKVPVQKKDKKDEAKLDQLFVKLQKYIKDNHLENQLELHNIPVGVQITLKEEILFDLGKADLKNEAKPILQKVGGIFESVDNPISIEGHTDNNPIKYSSEFKSNWELAAARAHNVAMFLINSDGIKPNRVRYTSYGEYNPRVPNDTKEHQAMNRRVNIIILRETPINQ